MKLSECSVHDCVTNPCSKCLIASPSSRPITARHLPSAANQLSCSRLNLLPLRSPLDVTVTPSSRFLRSGGPPSPGLGADVVLRPCPFLESLTGLSYDVSWKRRRSVRSPTSRASSALMEVLRPDKPREGHPRSLTTLKLSHSLSRW